MPCAAMSFRLHRPAHSVTPLRVSGHRIGLTCGHITVSANAHFAAKQKRALFRKEERPFGGMQPAGKAGVPA